MITILIAGLRIGLETDSPAILRRCTRFLTDGAPDFTVRAAPEEIAAEQALVPSRTDSAEFVCLYRAIAERLPSFDRFVLHGATVRLGPEAYIFTAKSGTGKSTHIRLWMARYGDAVQVVNGDKPVIWKQNGKWLACGTPWCGKEGLTSTDNVPVSALCLLERAPENRIRPASGTEVVEAVFHQIYRPKDPERLLRFLGLLDEFLCATPIWRMGCNMELSAAEVSHDAMTAGRPQEQETP